MAPHTHTFSPFILRQPFISFVRIDMETQHEKNSWDSGKGTWTNRLFFIPYTTGHTIAPTPINFYTPFILLFGVSATFSNCIHHRMPHLSSLSIFIITLTGSKLLNLNDVGSENMLSFIFTIENQCYTLAV